MVTAIELQDSIFNHYIELPGDVATDQNILIYPEFSGVLLEVLVDEGEHVRKGQLLARIDDGGLSSQLAQAEAQAALAKTTFERQERLWEQRIGSEIQFLEARTNFEAVTNSVEQLRSQMSKTQVRAAFSGIIDEVISDEGEVVSPGQNQLFRLINLSDMYIVTAVPENYLSQVKKGTKVLVEIAAAGFEFESEIEQVGNFINPNNRTFEIRVSVPNNNQQVKPNLIATVKLNDYSSENAISIPENLIQKNAAGENLVFVVVPETDSTGVAKRRIVETGYDYENTIEILQGIEAGDLLISEGGRKIGDGEQVKFRKN